MFIDIYILAIIIVTVYNLQYHTISIWQILGTAHESSVLKRRSSYVARCLARAMICYESAVDQQLKCDLKCINQGSV